MKSQADSSKTEFDYMNYGNGNLAAIPTAQRCPSL